MKLQTPHSEIDLSANTYWELVNIPTTGRLSANLNAYIGKEDVMLFTGELPDSFKEAYPFRPLVIRAGTDGNLKEMQISRFTVDLPGAFSLEGGGILENLADSITRSGTIGLKMITQNLNFLTALSGEAPNGTIVIPDSMNMVAQVDIKGSEYKANCTWKEGTRSNGCERCVNTATEVYKAEPEN